MTCDGRTDRQTMMDAKWRSSHGFWPGELKIMNFGQKFRLYIWNTTHKYTVPYFLTNVYTCIDRQVNANNLKFKVSLCRQENKNQQICVQVLNSSY